MSTADARSNPLVVGFDLDMTLIDSRSGVAATFEKLARETGRPIDGVLAASRLGPPLEIELGHYFTEDEVPAAADRFRALYAEIGIVGTAALRGARAAIAAVHDAGGAVIVVTAKFEVNAHLCLDHVGLPADAVIGWRHGAMKGETLREFGARVYVGDSPPDMLGAAIARAVAVGVATGPHDAAELIAAGAHIVLPTLDDFPAWFTDWRRGAI